LTFGFCMSHWARCGSCRNLFCLRCRIAFCTWKPATQIGGSTCPTCLMIARKLI
jgi:hypothetical protein